MKNKLRLVSLFTLWAGLGPASLAEAANSRLLVAPVSSNTGAAGTREELRVWDGAPAGISHLRVLDLNGTPHVAVLDQRAGELEIWSLGAGTLGSRRSRYNLGRRFSAMDMATPGNVPHLVLHDLADGAVRIYPVNDNGTLGSGVTSTANAWRDRDLLATYRVGSIWYLFGYDRFSGGGLIHRTSGEAVSTFNWSLGWTEADFVTLTSGTYRALYKHNDHPGADGSHLKIDRISSTGTILATSADEHGTKGFSSVQFVRVQVPGLGGPTTAYFLLSYEAASGAYTMRPFNGITLGAVSASGDLGERWVEIESYQYAGQTYLLLLEQEPVDALSATQIENIAASLEEQLDGQVPGYQAELEQYGRTILRDVGGLVNVPNDTPMTIDRHVNVGSVGKLFTTATILKLADDGELDLDNPVIDYLPYTGEGTIYDFAEISADMRYLTLRELLTYSSGLGTGCGGADGEDEIDCTAAFYAARDPMLCQPSADVPADLDCDYEYMNSNYSILRVVIEHHLGVQGVEHMVAFTRHLWMERARMTQATCLNPPGDAAYYIQVASCNEPWVGNELSTTPSCAAGGWYLPGREMMRFLRDAKSEQIVGPELTAYFLDSNLETGTGDSTAVGWDRSGTQSSCKSGGASYTVALEGSPGDARR